MQIRTLASIAIAITLGGGALTAFAHHDREGKGTPDKAQLEALAARYAPVELTVDLSKLPPEERRALAKMVEAARLMDSLFLRQVWAGSDAMLIDLAADRTALGQARLDNFLINKGPWDRIDHDRVLVPGAPAKPGHANFYPAGATKEEVETWMAGLSEAQAREAKGFFTTIRRGADGRFVSVPYSLEYQGELALAAQLLREAAALTRQPTLQSYLEKRAAAFLSNDYYESDIAWMELDASLEPTIGPYETYEDEWFGYKAAFEAFVTVRDDAETEKLKKFGAELQGLEDQLPIDRKMRNPKLGALAPIRVVNVVFTSGDANRGVQTAAFNLPNDERVIREKGSKRVMLKNVQQAKFDNVLVPISRVALSKKDQAKVSFDPFFTHILMHELMHGLGPHAVRTKDGKESTPRHELKDTYSALEEAKADISGLWALQKLVDKGSIDESMEDSMYETFVAGAFRTLRFGIGEAHGKGMALQLNWLLDRGAVKVEKDGTFSVNRRKMKAAVTGLTAEIMTIQGTGDYARAKALLDRMVVIRPETQRVIDQLGSVPTDIRPRFVTAEHLEALSEAVSRGGG